MHFYHESAVYIGLIVCFVSPGYWLAAGRPVSASSQLLTYCQFTRIQRTYNGTF